ncbi:MAG: choice-of-anchor B family protein [Alphaproteobacteria bacterium]|nr:choice-of-anchor B family protein [Alphaproteobacteria bacterium]
MSLLKPPGRFCVQKGAVTRFGAQTAFAVVMLFAMATASPDRAAAQADFSTSGPFDTHNMTLLDQKSPRELGLTDLSIVADIWGWTDPLNGEEYIIAAADAHNVPRVIEGADQAAALYQPIGGVVFARLAGDGEILPLGVWRHPDLAQTDHGDVQVYANHAYVSGEAPGYGLVIFDLTLLRERTPCLSPEDCAGPALNDLPDFAVVKTSLSDLKGRQVSINNSHNLTIDEASGFMAIHAADTAKDATQRKRRALSTKVLKINPGDPRNPVVLTDLNRYSHDGVITRYHGPDPAHQGKIIMALANGYKHFVGLVNVTEFVQNPKNGPSIYQLTEVDGETVGIKKLSRLTTYAGDEFGHQLALSEDHRYIFFNDETQMQGALSARQIVFDIAALKVPEEIFQCFYDVETGTHDGYVAGGLLFNSNYTSGLRVVDVGDVEGSLCRDDLLNEVAYIDTEPRLNSFSDVLQFKLSDDVTLQAFSDFSGTWGNYPFFASGTIVVSDFFNGIFAVTLDLPDD